MRPMNSKAKRIEHLTAKFINERRARRGLDRLDTDSALVSAAREHSRDMARRGYVAHESDHHGSPDDRVEKYNNVSECITVEIGWGRRPHEIAGDALESWMTSPPHRRGLLEDGLNRMGVGVWRSGNMIYLTQMATNTENQILGRWGSVW